MYSMAPASAVVRLDPEVSFNGAPPAVAAPALSCKAEVGAVVPIPVLPLLRIVRAFERDPLLGPLPMTKIGSVGTHESAFSVPLVLLYEPATTLEYEFAMVKSPSAMAFCAEEVAALPIAMEFQFVALELDPIAVEIPPDATVPLPIATD